MKLDLRNVTLISICGTMKHVPISKISLFHCQKYADFGDTILFSTKEDSDFKTVKIPIFDFSLYNQFCVEQLNSYIKTDYCLITQEDGSIVDPSFWSDDFFNFDYIGSPWPSYNFKVGNGGFSLRSKKFLEESAKLKYTGDAHIKAGFGANIFAQGFSTPEDFFLCMLNDEKLMDNGVKFADATTAYQFSVEYSGDGYEQEEKFCKYFHPADITTYKSFGFHGRFNVAGMRELLKTQRELEKEGKKIYEY